jgi:hypothetical protein
MENEFLKNRFHVTRRHFLGKLSLGLGSVALGSLLIPDLLRSGGEDGISQIHGLPHFAPKAKRIIYLFQNGAPSQLESFDYKPLLNKMTGEELPAACFYPNGSTSYWNDLRASKVSTRGLSFFL